MKNLSKFRNLVSEVRIDHPAYSGAINAIEKAIRGAGQSTSPVCVMLVGETGTGKSSVIKDVCAEFAAERSKTGLKSALVHATAPSNGTPKGMAEMLLRALGDPHYTRGSLSAMTARLYKLLESVGCQAILVDEFQHLADKGQRITLHRASDWLKVLVEDQPYALIGAGLPECRRVVTQNAQLSRRFSAPIVMPTFRWNSKGSQNSWRMLLGAFQENLDPFELPDLKSEEIAYRMYLASAGRIGLLAKILEQAVRDAIDQNRHKIPLSQLQTAFERAIWTASTFSVEGGPFGSNIDALYAQRPDTVSISGDTPDAPGAHLVRKGRKPSSAAQAKRELEKTLRC
jgi:hypothetical protein